MIDYESITVRELKRMVNQREATAAEIGLFVAYATRETESGRKSVVTNELLRWIEGKWVTRPYANELNYWIEFGKHLRGLELMGVQEILLAYASSVGVTASALGLERAVYRQAFKSLHAEARGHGLCTPGLSDELAAALAAQAPDEGRYPTEILVTAWERALGNASRLKAQATVLADLSRFVGFELLDVGLEDALRRLEETRATLERFRAYAPEIDEAVAGLQDCASVESDRGLERQLTAIASRYLLPGWRLWAQEGATLAEAVTHANRLVEAIDYLVAKTGIDARSPEAPREGAHT